MVWGYCTELRCLKFLSKFLYNIIRSLFFNSLNNFNEILKMDNFILLVLCDFRDKLIQINRSYFYEKLFILSFRKYNFNKFIKIFLSNILIKGKQCFGSDSQVNKYPSFNIIQLLFWLISRNLFINHHILMILIKNILDLREVLHSTICWILLRTCQWCGHELVVYDVRCFSKQLVLFFIVYFKQFLWSVFATRFSPPMLVSELYFIYIIYICFFLLLIS